MKNGITFEELSLPGEIYESVMNITLFCLVVGVILMILTAIFVKKNVKTILGVLMRVCYIPRIIVSLLAIGFIFFYDYNTGTVGLVKLDNMLLTTYFVGILAIIEFLSTLASIIKDVYDK